MMDWLRKAGRLEFADEVEIIAKPEPSLADAEEHEEILKFMNWLQPNERDILELVYVEEMDVVEAGERLGLAKWAAYKTYQRALTHLRDLLTEHGVQPIRA